MAKREPSPTDFTVNVEGVGQWVFARRTMGDAIKIKQEVYRLGGEAAQHDDELRGWVGVMAALTVLTVRCPPGWEDLEGIDMLDPEDKSGKMLAVWEKLKEVEDSFRKKPAVQGKAARA